MVDEWILIIFALGKYWSVPILRMSLLLILELLLLLLVVVMGLVRSIVLRHDLSRVWSILVQVLFLVRLVNRVTRVGLGSGMSLFVSLRTG